MFNKNNKVDLSSRLASSQKRNPKSEDTGGLDANKKTEVPSEDVKIDINKAVPDDREPSGRVILTMQQKLKIEHEENKKREKEGKRKAKEEAKKEALKKKEAEREAKKERAKKTDKDPQGKEETISVKEAPVREKPSRPEKIRKERRVDISKTDYSYETEIEESEEFALSEAAALARKEKRSRFLTRIVTALLIIACIYLVMLIYGVVVTDYSYNENGEIVPVVLSVKEVKAKNEFEPVLGQYETCRLMYEKILMIDYRLSEGYAIGDGGGQLTAQEMEERYKVIASEYQALISSKENLNIDNLGIKLDALEVDSKYAAVKSYMITWLSDTSYYLTKMSRALSANDQTAAGEALVAREKIYNEFSIITQNIIALGDNVKGIDMTDIKEWSPEDYVDKQVNGD